MRRSDGAQGHAGSGSGSSLTEALGAQVQRPKARPSVPTGTALSAATTHWEGALGG